MGVASSVGMTGGELRVDSVEECAVIAPIVRLIAPGIQWDSVTDLRTP